MRHYQIIIQNPTISCEIPTTNNINDTITSCFNYIDKLIDHGESYCLFPNKSFYIQSFILDVNKVVLNGKSLIIRNGIFNCSVFYNSTDIFSLKNRISEIVYRANGSALNNRVFTKREFNLRDFSLDHSILEIK